MPVERLFRISPHPVLGEHAALPLGGEGVERQVEREQHHPARHAATLLLLPEHIGSEVNSLGGVLWRGTGETGTQKERVREARVLSNNINLQSWRMSLK